MTREIKFRGLKIGKRNVKWIYGVPIFSLDNTRILGAFENTKGHPTELVEKETIGQFTGLKDKNGVEIYEGDIVVHPADGNMPKLPYKIVWSETRSMWVVEEKTGGHSPLWAFGECFIKGNIYQNPELLK